MPGKNIGMQKFPFTPPIDALTHLLAHVSIFYITVGLSRQCFSDTVRRLWFCADEYEEGV